MEITKKLANCMQGPEIHAIVFNDGQIAPDERKHQSGLIIK